MARKAAAIANQENLPETAAPELPETIVSSLILHGDLSKLTPADKVQYYHAYCRRIGLDPVTQPFKILNLKGREVLYCDRSGTQQLNKLHNVSHIIKSREFIHDCYIVVAQASLQSGRHTESIGAVGISGLKGDNLCNALMKAETKAKRRATLDLLGLGILDETETETIPGDVTVPIEPQIVQCKKKLDEAKSLPHLANVWKKHYHQWKAELSADEFAELTEYKEDRKDQLSADFQEKQEAAAVAAKPEPEYLITADQIERIRQIVKPGGLGNGMLTELEIAKLLDCGNNPNSTQSETEILINDAMSVIRQRESGLKSELEGD